MPTRAAADVITHIPYGSSLLPSALLTRKLRTSSILRGPAAVAADILYGVFDKDVHRLLTWVRDSDPNEIPEFNGQMLQDAWVASNSISPGFFVDVGASEPRKYSNTYSLQRYLGWRGILIEANPRLAEKLQESRSSVDVSVANCAVAEKPGRFLFLDAGAMSSLAHTAHVDHLHRKRAKLASQFGSFEVTARPLNEILIEHKAPSTIDYLSIDIEGADLEAVHSIDLNYFDVRRISIEHNYNLTVLKEIVDYLRPYGYQQVCTRWSSIDAWFVKSEVRVK